MPERGARCNWPQPLHPAAFPPYNHRMTALTPAERRRRKVRAVVITGVLLAAVAVPVILVQTTTTVHPRCDVNGAFYSGGTIIVSSINCGDFARPGDQSDYDAVSGRFETYDIVTRGFWLGHPLLVEFRPVEG